MGRGGDEGVKAAETSGSTAPAQQQEQEQQEPQQSAGMQPKRLAGFALPDPEHATQVDERDEDCPDNWVPRKPELLRLTGLHPFNCEPPLPVLMDKGFLTPAPLHYVRNHGPVPQLSWEAHRVELLDVDGRVVHELSMEELTTQFERRTLPVTLTCAGNRRKEQNMVKQSMGFSWGCGAVSTSVWTGVRLADVLERYGLLGDDRVKYVNYEGADTLPKGKYGTSLALSTALDPSRDVILAFEQNGERLLPDHGFPVRMLIPGFIGGRMVKWLAKIQVSDRESESHYHYYDNRLLPPQIDEDTAAKDGWWHDPAYIINDRNLNSAIAAPAHNEVLHLADAGPTYTLGGYAYNGGGRRVTRVEVSLDGGETWELTKLVQPEEPNKYGKYWCWSFWSLDIDPTRLLAAREVACRAWDESTNTQPGNLTWSLLGMMQNAWFRVKVYPVRTSRGIALTFKHPATIEDNGGWMAEEAPAPEKPDEAEVAAAAAAAEKLPQFTRGDVAQHNTPEDCWIIVGDLVYSITAEWIEDHPGGAKSITGNAGKDVTDFFNTIHSSKARKLLEEYVVGRLSNDVEAKL